MTLKLFAALLVLASNTVMIGADTVKAHSQSKNQSLLWISTFEEGGYVNLRSSPTIEAEVVGYVENTQKVEKLLTSEYYRLPSGSSNRWYQVNTGRSVGWIFGDFISFVAPIDPRADLSCDQTVAWANRHLENLPNVSITVSGFDLHSDADGPINRDKSYDFGIVGSGTQSVIASQVMQNQIAARMIRNCPTLGMVSFGFPEERYHNTYGLMHGGMVNLFRCVDRPERPAWGEMYCGL